MSSRQGNRSEELYSIKWDYYQGHITKGLQRFFADTDNDALKDVTLGSEDHYIPCHKLILSLCSPYFKRIFEASSTQKDSSGATMVLLEHIKFKDLKNVVHFIYNGDIKISNSDLKGFLRAGELLQIEGLMKSGKDDEERESPERTQPLTSIWRFIILKLQCMVLFFWNLFNVHQKVEHANGMMMNLNLTQYRNSNQRQLIESSTGASSLMSIQSGIRTSHNRSGSSRRLRYRQASFKVANFPSSRIYPKSRSQHQSLGYMGSKSENMSHNNTRYQSQSQGYMGCESDHSENMDNNQSKTSNCSSSSRERSRSRSHRERGNSYRKSSSCFIIKTEEDRPWVCIVCGSSFKSKNGVYNHRYMMHRGLIINPRRNY